MRIAAFDPGATTGVATYDEYSGYRFVQLEENLKEIYEFLEDYNPKDVVYEKFRYRPTQGFSELYSVEVTGVIKLYTQNTGCRLVNTPPAPGNTKPFWTNEKIKKLDLYQPGMKHSMDALRVLLWYRQAMEPVWFKEILYKLK